MGILDQSKSEDKCKPVKKTWAEDILGTACTTKNNSSTAMIVSVRISDIDHPKNATVTVKHLN